MKKNLLVCVMAAAAVFTLTGCGNKDEKKEESTTTAKQEQKLQCTLAADGNSSKYSFVFEDDKISKVTVTNTEKKKDEKTAKKGYEQNSKEVGEYNKNKGVTASASYSGTLVTTSLTYTVASLDETSKALYNETYGEIADKGMEAIKSDLTAVGYTCK
jgi:uncharacterized lipoprotein YehR (DUF1307 family)